MLKVLVSSNTFLHHFLLGIVRNLLHCSLLFILLHAHLLSSIIPDLTKALIFSDYFFLLFPQI